MCKRRGTALVLLGLAVVVASIGAQGEAPTDTSGKAFLGITVEPTLKGAERAGVIVRDLAPDSPAAKAKLKPGDLILKVGATEVKDYEQLVNAVSKHKPGDKVALQVLRDGEEKELTVTLSARRAGGQPLEGPGRPTAHLGVQMQPLTPELKARLGLSVDQGVIVAEVFPETPAAKAGLKRGDIVTKAGAKEIADPKDLRDMIAQTGVGKELKLTVLRGKETKELTAQLREPPVDGLSMPFPIRPPVVRELPSLPKALEMISDLEKKIRDLEKRIKQLEEKSGKSPD